MGVFNNFPYTNFHELNLDWLLKKMKELEAAWNSWKAVNQIVFADPVDWSTVRTYAQHVIVIHDGIGYLSRKPVPAGINIDNAEYWEQITNYGNSYSKTNHTLKMYGTTEGGPDDTVDIIQINDIPHNVRDAYAFNLANTNKTAITLLNADMSNAVQSIAKLNADLTNHENSASIYTGEKTLAGLQAAVDALDSHATLIIPFGTYDGTGSLFLNKPIQLEGQYGGAVFPDTTPVFNNFTIDINSSGVIVSNIAVFSATSQPCYLVEPDAGDVYFSHCYAYSNLQAEGFTCRQRVHNITFNDCYAFKCSHGFSIGLDSEANENDGLVFINCYAQGCGNSGFLIKYTHGSVLLSCSVENGNANGIEITGGSALVSGCIVSANKLSGAYLTNADVTFIADTFAQCNLSGIDGQGCIHNDNGTTIVIACTVIDYADGVNRALHRIANNGRGACYGCTYGYAEWGASDLGFGLKNWNSADVIGETDDKKLYAVVNAPTDVA